MGFWRFPSLFSPPLTDPEGNPLIDRRPLANEQHSCLWAWPPLGLAIGIIVVMQDAIIEEIQLGTAAWVLSKPVSRQAFLSAKLVASVVGMLLPDDFTLSAGGLWSVLAV